MCVHNSSPFCMMIEPLCCVLIATKYQHNCPVFSIVIVSLTKFLFLFFSTRLKLFFILNIFTVGEKKNGTIFHSSTVFLLLLLYFLNTRRSIYLITFIIFFSSFFFRDYTFSLRTQSACTGRTQTKGFLIFLLRPRFFFFYYYMRRVEEEEETLRRSSLSIHYYILMMKMKEEKTCWDFYYINSCRTALDR